MLTSIIVGTTSPTEFKIEDADPNEILIVKSITGLTGPDVTLFTGDYAGDGGYYQGRRAGAMHPTITFKMNPDYANDIEVSDIRKMLYKMFREPAATSDGVQVVLKDDRDPDRYFIAYTDKIDTEPFSQTQTAQVSMVSVYPYLLSVTPVDVVNAGGFSSVPITYDGTADVGFYVKTKIVTAVNTVTIDLNGVTMQIVNPTGNFAVNDIIEVSTVMGSRYIRKTTSGVTTDIMAMLTSTSTWLQLNTASETLKVYGTAVADGKAVGTEYKYNSTWWGI